jgi:asparagine synthase (glutamine-hydrolysing)
MCGIAGVVGKSGGLSRDVAKGLAREVRHRGPDDQGFLVWGDGKGPRLSKEPLDALDGQVVFAHQRLSIIDLSAAGWQPMGTSGGRYFIVFNGEIYNYVELRQELEKLGWAFRSQSDTEVLLHAYAQWGSNALNRLVGMFAFAVLDTVERSLFLARDFFGIKPLFYAHHDGTFVFASEIKALLKLPSFPREVNPGRVYEYLRFGGLDHGGETLFGQIRQLPAAHYLKVSLDRPIEVRLVNYWKVDLHERTSLCLEDAAEKLRSLFLDSVRLHLRSDVPVGACLSGGIDSSSIVAAIRHLEPDVELHTFSYAADDPSVNEERWIDMAGHGTGAVVHKVRPTPEELVKDLDDLIAVQDEPFGSTSIYAQYRVFRLAKEAGIKVMLDGQGADELLGGYAPYLSTRLASLVAGGAWFEAMRFTSHARRLPHVRTGTLLFSAGGLLLPDSMRPWARRLIKQELTPPWLNERWFIEHEVKFVEPSRPRGKEMLRRHLWESLEFGLRSLLRYEDRNSMAHSIESRVPFLTPQVAQFIYSLPQEYIVDRNGVSKAIFRRAMRGLVPDMILERQDKIGFATPEQRWLTTLKPWVETVLDSDAARCVPALNHKALATEWRDMLGGQRPFDWRVWRWINLIRWAELRRAEFT